MLSPGERETWLRMRAVEKRRQEWLLGRCAAKDAVRLLVEEYTGVHLAPAEVEIVPDPYGRPAGGGRLDRAPRHPAGSFRSPTAMVRPWPSLHYDSGHTGGHRSGKPGCSGARISKPSPFSPDERQMLAALPPSRGRSGPCACGAPKKRWPRRWAAVLAPGIQAFHITSAETASGIVATGIARSTPWNNSRACAGKSLTVYTGARIRFCFFHNYISTGSSRMRPSRQEILDYLLHNMGRI